MRGWESFPKIDPMDEPAIQVDSNIKGGEIKTMMIEVSSIPS